MDTFYNALFPKGIVFSQGNNTIYLVIDRDDISQNLKDFLPVGAPQPINLQYNQV